MHNTSILQNKYCTIEAYPEEISWETLSFVYHLPGEEKAQSENQPWPEEKCRGVGHPVPTQTPWQWPGLFLRRQTAPDTQWGWEQNDSISSCWDCSSRVFTLSRRERQPQSRIQHLPWRWESNGWSPLQHQKPGKTDYNYFSLDTES